MDSRQVELGEMNWKRSLMPVHLHPTRGLLFGAARGLGRRWPSQAPPRIQHRASVAHHFHLLGSVCTHRHTCPHKTSPRTRIHALSSLVLTHTLGHTVTNTPPTPPRPLGPDWRTPFLGRSLPTPETARKGDHGAEGRCAQIWGSPALLKLQWESRDKTGM